MTEKPTVPKGASTVVVGCKLPNGLICELGNVEDDNYQRVNLKGSNDSEIIGGYGITRNVPAAFWEAWIEAKKRMPFVRKGLVFAVGDVDSAKDLATDFSEKKTGMERLDPAQVKKIAPGVEADMDHLKQGLRDGMQRARAN